MKKYSEYISRLQTYLYVKRHILISRKNLNTRAPHHTHMTGLYKLIAGLWHCLGSQSKTLSVNKPKVRLKLDYKKIQLDVRDVRPLTCH